MDIFINLLEQEKSTKLEEMMLEIEKPPPLMPEKQLEEEKSSIIIIDLMSDEK